MPQTGVIEGHPFRSVHIRLDPLFDPAKQLELVTPVHTLKGLAHITKSTCWQVDDEFILFLAHMVLSRPGTFQVLFAPARQASFWRMI